MNLRSVHMSSIAPITPITPITPIALITPVDSSTESSLLRQPPQSQLVPPTTDPANLIPQQTENAAEAVALRQATEPLVQLEQEPNLGNFPAEDLVARYAAEQAAAD